MSIVDLFRKVVQGKLNAKQAAVRMTYDDLCHISELEEAKEKIDVLEEKNKLYLSLLSELQELITQHFIDINEAAHPPRNKYHEESAIHLYRGMETLLRNIQEELESEE